MLCGYLVLPFYPLVQLMRAHKSAAEVNPSLLVLSYVGDGMTHI